VRRVWPALALALVLAGGCGEPEREERTDERLTKEEFVEQADAICAEYDRRLDALPDPENVRGIADVANQAFPIAQEGIRKLRELRPPEELEPQVERWLRLNDANARAIHALAEAAENADTQRVQEIASDAAENERRADALAKEIGLVECARREAPG
jgi:hypothetical protein